MRIIGLLLVLLAIACVCSICIGAVKIPVDSLFSIVLNNFGIESEKLFTAQQQAVFSSLRLPRMLLGVLVGATISIAGASIQGLFRNPLAEPSLIGISSGASLFAVLMIVLEARFFQSITAIFGYYALAIAAFVGAVLTTFIVYRFSVKNGRTDVTSLLLIGIAINALVGAFTGLLTYIASDEQLRNITFWSLGSLGGANWKTVSALLPFSIISIVGLLLFGKTLNAISLGESQAEHLGFSLHKSKKLIILFAAIGVGAAVAVSGIISFIGLVVPHILRMSVTGNNRFVLPASAILGACILVAADLIARTIVAPTELPIGILTAIIGVPVFLYIIFKERKRRISG
ncbi:Fe3+-siderophore ABC transporter permease [Sphingobacterium sp. KB22]|uniref:Fe3+-siderophore ABC transporter permease n=1 Tax=Sphingobacterium hungaricum TaxID=2082723 RepID=A0A928UYK4_9SPHI|nr:Fe3+-siderophore ABC transporter permease [Sphingobacterium hungaricum]